MRARPCQTVLAVAFALVLPAGELAAQAIEEIVVTTRRREEKLQEVPIAITAISDEFIERAGIRGINDIVKLSPSLSINESFSQNDLRITVRGLTNTRGRANVAFLVDGVDVTSETTGTNAGSPLLINQRLLNDIERVEILRGPQSALYGRAAFAGAISYVTKEPGAEWDGHVGLEAAEEGAYEVNGAMTVPILGEALSARLNGVVWTEDGFYANAVSGEDTGGGEGYAVAGTLLYRPTENLKLKGRLTWSDDKYDIRSVAVIDNNLTLPMPPEANENQQDPDGDYIGPVTTETSVNTVGEVGSADGLEVRASDDALTGGEYPGSDLEVFRATFLAEWDAGSYLFSAYTGITNADFTQRYDVDRQAEGRPDRILGQNEVDTIDETDQFSQELRIASQWDGPLQLTLGGLYWTEDRSSRNRNVIVVCSDVDACYRHEENGQPRPYYSWQSMYLDLTGKDGGVRVPTSGETDHWSAYGLLEWQATDTIKVSVEDRYVDEDFYAELPTGSTCNNFYPFAGPNPLQPVNTDPASPFFNFGCRFDTTKLQTGTVNTAYQTPKMIIDWKVAEDVMFYASAAKGEKPGGVSLLTIAAPVPQPFSSFVFKPEKMWTYEVGAKMAWAGDLGRLVMNVAGFRQDYTDKQTGKIIYSNGFPLAIVSNAGSAKVDGLELETSWATPLDGLTVTGAYTWLDAEYDDYRDITRSPPTIAQLGTCDDIVLVITNPEEVEMGLPPRYSPNCAVDFSGHELEYAPEHAIVAGLSFRRQFADTGADYLAELDARFQDEVFTNSVNVTRLDSYWQLNLRAGLMGENWQFIAFLNNALDDDTIRNLGSNPDFAAGAVDAGAPGSARFSTTATLPEPRVFGIRLSRSF